jgi:cell division protein FtsZ
MPQPAPRPAPQPVAEQEDHIEPEAEAEPEPAEEVAAEAAPQPQPAGPSPGHVQLRPSHSRPQMPAHDDLPVHVRGDSKMEQVAQAATTKRKGLLERLASVGLGVRREEDKPAASRSASLKWNAAHPKWPGSRRQCSPAAASHRSVAG